MAYVEVDVDVEDFLDQCYDSEIERIIEILTKDGYLKSTQLKEPEYTEDSEWHTQLTKLRDRGRMQLTNEEESLILHIANKVV
jgi:hypothetical protein